MAAILAGDQEERSLNEGALGRRSSASEEYARRLTRLQAAWWKRIIPVQAPYRWHLKRLKLGRTLDVGCGNGRNLGYLGSTSVGVDHNRELVSIARSRGLNAFTPEDFRTSAHTRRGVFDSILFAHVLEHMSLQDAEELVREYLPYVRSHGTVVMIAPQERGFASDPTHVEFMDLRKLRQLNGKLGLVVNRAYSFPFPRNLGRFFAYNEFVVLAKTQGERPENAEEVGE